MKPIKAFSMALIYAERRFIARSGLKKVVIGGHGAPEFTFETCSCGSHGELPQ